MTKKMDLASYQNAPNDRGGRWIENPAAAGLRFVGFADECSPRGWIDHRGWFLDDVSQDETARGAVYQLPARNGCTVYVEAVRMGRDGRHGWQDACGSDTGPAIVYLGERHLGQPGGSWREHEQAAIDAARGADREAEILAERERDYNAAWQSANRWQDIGEEMATVRKSARQLVADMRAAIKGGVQAAPSICEALRSQVRALMGQWDVLRQARDNLDIGFDYWRDGRSLSIAEFAAREL